ncbi:MAG: alpha/beta fold hydrolase [Bacteroidetes bacterium]|nr:MAG: alpha/beta fold hydrolase [Bacteroidota bacterium]
MPAFSPARIIGSLFNGMSLVAPGLAGRIAFYLFGFPLRKKVKPQESQFLATADLHYEQINGNKIAVYHWGFRGPVILLAHGWESHAGRWRKIAPPLVQAGFQVVAVDAPAHGRSSGRHFTMVRYAEVLRVIFQRYGRVDAFIGHSVGGSAGIWAMGTLSPALRPRQAVILAAFSSLEYIMANARKMVGASPALMTAMETEIIRRFGQGIPYFSLTRQAGKLEAVEALLVHDRHDKVTAYTESQYLHAAWAGSRLHETEGFGHGLTAPAVLETVLEFVHEDIVV